MKHFYVTAFMEVRNLNCSCSCITIPDLIKLKKKNPYLESLHNNEH